MGENRIRKGCYFVGCKICVGVAENTDLPTKSFLSFLEHKKYENRMIEVKSVE